MIHEGKIGKGNFIKKKKKKTPFQSVKDIVKRTWRNLKRILLSESSQSEKATYCTIPTQAKI